MDILGLYATFLLHTQARISNFENDLCVDKALKDGNCEAWSCTEISKH